MTNREALQKEIERIEWDLFILSMKDKWDNQDYAEERELIKEKNEIEKKLEELKND